MTQTMVQVLVAVVVIALAVAALISFELNQRLRGGRQLPGLRKLPASRARAPRHV